MTSRLLLKASDIYATVDFNTDALFNEPAPEPWINFTIGGILAVIGFGYWLKRVKDLKTEIGEENFKGDLMIRAMISAAIDSDSSPYVIISYSAVSFIFLGGIQLHFQWTLLAMIAFYCVSSLGDTVRVLLAYNNANSLKDLYVTSDLLKAKLRNVTTKLKPSNVYEDLGRGRSLVFMIFATQCIMISFVCVDIYENDTTKCRDGSSPCPIGGTLGSWGFYVLGIFMACVFQLGPKTSFGQSEQNPTYWLQLLLSAKKTGAKVTWKNEIKNKEMQRDLKTNDSGIWLRFLMSYLINGIGYHILVHALPLQVGFQSSFTGVVFRAVGMMYIVDLDDTAGYELTIVDLSEEEEKKKKEEEEKKKQDKTDSLPEKEEVEESKPIATTALSPAALSEEAQKIIDEAREKLDALARGELPETAPTLTPGALLMSTVPSPEVEAPAEEAQAEPDVEAAAPEVESRGIAKKDKDGEDDTGVDAGDEA